VPSKGEPEDLFVRNPMSKHFAYSLNCKQVGLHAIP
jgi:hypothetical protein